LADARSLVAAGQGHNLLPRGCVPKVVAHFIAKLDPKTLDAPCLAELQPSPPFLSQTGPAP
jgi:hypothetical protein